MKYHITKLPKSEIELSVKISQEELSEFRKVTVSGAAQNIEIPGFRKGKAPLDLVESKIGEQQLLDRALMLFVENTYPKILAELKEKEGPDFEPIGAPQVEIVKPIKEEVEYKAHLFILPAIHLPDYKKITSEVKKNRKIIEVSEKETDDAVEWLRQSRAALITVSRPAQKNDRVEIDFEASIEGKSLENGRSTNHPVIIGENKFILGFEDELVGLKAGETKNFSITAPKDYGESQLRNKKLDFIVTVKLVQKRVLPELTDEFASGLGKFQNIADLKRSVGNGIKSEKEEKGRQRIRMEIISKIADQAPAEIPDLLIERELEKMIQELKSNLTGMMPWEKYLAAVKKDEAELKRGWTKDAEQRVKIALVLRKIAAAEKLEPTEEEIQEATNQNIMRLGIDEESFSAKGGSASGGKKIDRNAFLEYNIVAARNEKVFKFLEA